MRLTCCLLTAYLWAGHQAVAQDSAATGAIVVPLTPERWAFQRLYRRDRTDDTNPRFESHLGRPSLFLPNGFALANGVTLRNGTLEADVAAYEGGAFFGLAFHVATPPDRYEIVFFRPHAPDGTVQYAPSFYHMNAWQFFSTPDYLASLAFPQDRWVHLRVVIKGLVASVYLDTASTPTIQIHDLTLGSVAGSIGVWARGGGGFVSNIQYRPDTASYPSAPEHGFLPGAITQGWSLSDASTVSERDPETYPNVRALHWQAVPAEGEGMVLISRYRPDPNVEGPKRFLDRAAPATPGMQVVFARTTLTSDRDAVRKMWIGYSDDVVVYLNGRPLYAGRNSMSYRDPGGLGYVYPYADAVFLPLRKGPNELLLAVSEATAGWGFMCRLDPP
jgi:hypothetical protein